MHYVNVFHRSVELACVYIPSCPFPHTTTLPFNFYVPLLLLALSRSISPPAVISAALSSRRCNVRIYADLNEDKQAGRQADRQAGKQANNRGKPDS